MELSNEQIQVKRGRALFTKGKGNGQQNLESLPLASKGKSKSFSENDWRELVGSENDLDEMKNKDLLNSGEHCKPEMQQNRILSIQRADKAVACINESLV